MRDQTTDALDRAPRVVLFRKQQIRAFTKVDAVTYRADLQGADPLGLRRPDQT